jgi:hypothetical protein
LPRIPAVLAWDRGQSRGLMPVYDEDLANLDEWTRRLKVEYDIYFMGSRKKPPDDLRMRVEKLIKRLAEVTDMSISQRFLYNTLIARFYVYRDRWRRTQKERESAEGPSSTRVPSAYAPPFDPPAKTLPKDVQISISDPDAEAGKVRQLYEELLRMSENEAKEHPCISYQKFAGYIASQTQSLQKQHQCASVTFRIALVDKAVKFTVKADTNTSG